MSSRLGIALSCLLLVWLCTLYYSTDDRLQNATNDYNFAQENFRSLGLTHTGILNELLSLNSGRKKHYDDIRRLQKQQRDLKEKLVRYIEKVPKEHAGNISQQFHKYQATYEATLPLIDLYLRNNTFVHSSLLYSKRFFDALHQTSFARSDIAERLDHLTMTFLESIVQNSHDSDLVLIKELEDIGERVALDHPEAVPAFKTFSRHIKAVMQGYQGGYDNLNKILVSEHADFLKNTRQFYEVRQQKIITRLQFFADLLLFSLLFLVIVIFFGIARLIFNSQKLVKEKAILEASVAQSQESLYRTSEQLEQESEQRRLAEDELQSAAIFYQNCSQGVVICDKNKKTLSINSAYINITGIQLDEVVGQVPRLFDKAEVPAHIYEELIYSLDTKGEWRGEIETRNADGTSPKDVSVVCLKKQGEAYRYIIIITDIRERKKQQETIYFQANYDPLTKLPNRNLFNERAERMLARSQRNNSLFATLFIDLDNFKKINDNLGHPIGDELLIEVASRLTQSTRKTDTVSRFGGDEFIILLENLDRGGKLMRNIEDFIHCISDPVETSAGTFHISGSIGIALYPDDGDDIQTLIRCADISMYKAKQKGKNTYCFFEEKMDAEIHEALELENLLRDSIANDKGLSLVYQPIIDTVTNNTYGVESLLRWTPENREAVTPDIFIPIAEDSGLIISLGKWVLRTACQQLAEWNRNIDPELKMGINISTLQFSDPDFDASLGQILVETGALPQNINLEITESLLLEDDSNKIFDQLEALRKTGISISLDDFGTGYSSLSYLKRFPVDILKIDRCFVRDLTIDVNDRSLVIAIINMAKSLNIKTVAEGVETMEQAQQLSEYQCEYLQGYLISRPVKPEEIPVFLSAVPSDIEQNPESLQLSTAVPDLD